MRVSIHAVGPIYTNCYVVQDEGTGKTAVIDPGGVSEELFEQLDRIGKENIVYILLTHFHFDHIMGVKRLKERYGTTVAIHESEKNGLSDPALNGLDSFGYGWQVLPEADMTFKDGDVLEVGDLSFKVMHTPGHTMGSCCFICENAIFSGDTLFRMGMGRTDLPTGNPQKLYNSLLRLFRLDGNYDVYPGHDAKTTLDYERLNNGYNVEE